MKIIGNDDFGEVDVSEMKTRVLFQTEVKDSPPK